MIRMREDKHRSFLQKEEPALLTPPVCSNAGGGFFAMGWEEGATGGKEDMGKKHGR